MKRRLRRIVSWLCVLTLCLGLLPTAALAAENVQSTKGYFTFDYDNDGTKKIPITINLYAPDQSEPIDVLKVTDARGNQTKKTIALTDKISSEYDIERVEIDGGIVGDTTLHQDSYDFWLGLNTVDSSTISVYLCPQFEEPNVPEEIQGQGLTRTYRIYDDQILKMLRFAGVITVSEDTEIENVRPIWVSSFGIESEKSLTHENREIDYWDGSFTTDSGDVNEVQPNNIRRLEITYDNGDGEQTVSIDSGNLRYLIGSEASVKHYRIELDDDSFHVVYFYNEEGSLTGNNYLPYAVRFVDHEESLGDDMPPDPVYGDHNTYRFVNWEQESWDGSGDPFFDNTPVEEDLTVFAQKVSSPEDGGTEIHVMNYEDDQLLKRVVELYNAEHQTPIDVADIDLDSVKISVHGTSGKSTNEDYYNNGWQREGDDRENYYLVHNYNVDLEYGIDSTINTHVPFDDVQGITFYFKISGSNDIASIDIPVGQNHGDLSKDHQNTEHVLELRVIQRPQAPDDEDLNGDPEGDTGLLGVGAVKVECVNENVTHTPMSATYGLLAGGYTVPSDTDVKWTSDDQGYGYYYVDVPVTSGPYVTRYNENDGTDAVHTLAAGEAGTDTIRLKYGDAGWEVMSGETPVVFKVTCDDGGEEPGTDPDDGEITGITKTVVTQEPTWVTDGTYDYPEVKDGKNVVTIGAGTTSVTLLYEITVTGTAGTEFTVTDEDATLVPIEGVTITQGTGDKADEFTGTIPTDGTITFYVSKSFTIDENTVTLTNSASAAVTGSEDAPETDEEKVTVEEEDDGEEPDENPGLEITKTLDKVNGKTYTTGNVAVGDTLTYTITVTNTGNVALENVVVTDTFTGAGKLNFTSSYNATNNGDGTYTITIDSLPCTTDDNVATITATYEVVKADADKTITNSATATADEIEEDDETDNPPEVSVVEADILDDPVIYHRVNSENEADFETTDAETDKEHLVETTDPAISYQAVLDLSEMVLQDTANANQSVSVGPISTTIYQFMTSKPWEKLTNSTFWNLLNHGETTINLYVDFDDQLVVTKDAMQEVTVTSPYFERNGEVTYDSSTGYWVIPCKAVDGDPDTTGTDSDDEVVLSNITLHLTEDAQKELDSTKKLTLISGGYIDGTVTFGGALSSLNLTPLTIYGEAENDQVNLALDAWGGDDDEPGDGTADYKQALIQYVSAGNGTVDPTVQVETLTAGSDGTYSGSVTASSKATASSGYAFDYWSWGENETSYNAELSNSFTARGGQTYTYTAHFAKDDWSDGDKTPAPDDPDSEEGGDGIPDYKQALIQYVSAGNGTVSPTVQVETLEVTDGDGTYSGSVTASSKATASSDYAFDHWTHPDSTVTGDAQLNVQLTVEGGQTYTYTAYFTNGDYTVTIQPANITIYTGGETYGGVTDANGNIVVKEDGGLPEPGYRIELSQAVMDWLNLETGEAGARNLVDYLTFAYEDDANEREWELTYMGVYDTNPTRYVYRMSPVDPSNPEVRIAYTDAAGNHYFDDDIEMDANTVFDQYTMSIYDGELDQTAIQAVLTAGGESIAADVVIGTGTLTIRSTTDEEYVNDIGSDRNDVDRHSITAVGNVTYYVNDSEVEVGENRVGLLVDQVSNSSSFNREMARDAMNHAIDNTSWNRWSDLSYDMAYLDLVDTLNGHAVVTMGEGDSLTIYWPMPNDADRRGDFHVVHYHTMNRESIENDLDDADKEILTGEAVRIDGQWYVAFDTDSFSPFVLVYEAEDDDDDRPRPPRPDDDDDDEEEDDVEEPDETPVDDGLNREDHYAYLAGYTDGTIRPEGNITRAEVATIFFRLMTDEYREDCWSQHSGFTDVSSASWYNNAVSTTAQAGWIAGYEDGSFRPNAYITRAEFATIAARFLSEDYAGGHRFNDIQGHWAAEYIDRAAAAGWIGGYEDGSFRPNAYITRAEAVTLINRMLDRTPDANHLLADMVRWPDNPETAWYYADIQEATNSHDYIRAGTGNYEVWTELLANRDWAALEEIWSQANDAPGGEVMG